MPRFPVRKLVPALAVLALAACSGGGDSGTNPNPPGGPQVQEIHLTAGFRFSPANVTIQRGTRVRWINDAAVGHSITPDNPQQAGVWASQTVSAVNETYEFVFNTSGTFPYHCIPHRQGGMVGSITVQ